MKFLARGSFLLVTVLWGSFYAVAKAALTHVDPIIFTFFEAMVLVPIALTLLVLQRHTLNQAAFKRGLLLGSCLCIATLTITVSETFTRATNTAFFPSMGGTFAAIITAVVFGRSLTKSVWAACIVSLLGVLLIFHASLSGGELRGDLIALLGALLFTVYLFLVDQDAHQEKGHFWAILGIEHLSFALWMTLFSLLFGDWQHFHPVLSHDIPVILYISLACTFLPVILTHVAHRYIDPLETSFISILEPLWGVLLAHVYLGEVVTLPMALGGILILSSTLVHLIGAGNLSPFFHRVTGLLQKGAKSMRNALLKNWGNLVHLSFLIRFRHQMIVWKRQNTLQVNLSSSRYRSASWQGQPGTLPWHFWVSSCRDNAFWHRDLLLQIRRPSLLLPSEWMNTQAIIPYFSVWHVSSLLTSNSSICRKYSPERVWQQPSQHSIPP